MSHIVVQMGHCFRKRGATGTHREQEFASKVGPKLRDALVSRGHEVSLIGADSTVPRSDAFVALHTDGSSNPRRRGASVGYPNSTSAKLAHAWKRAHQRNGYPAGFHPDNYTAALGGYYGFRKAVATYEFLAEHGFTTCPLDEKWLFDNLDACVNAHVEAIGEVLGHPRKDHAHSVISQEDDMVEVYRDTRAPENDDNDLVAFVPAIGRRRIESPDELAYWHARGNIDKGLIHDLAKDPRLAAQVARLPWLEPSGR